MSLLDPRYCWHYRGGDRMCLRLAGHEGSHSYHKVAKDRLPQPKAKEPPRRTFLSLAEKQRIVAEARIEGRTIAAVARSEGVSYGTLKKWCEIM